MEEEGLGGQITFKLNLDGSDIGALLAKFSTDIEMAEGGVDLQENPVNKETVKVTMEVEGRVREHIENALGKDLVAEIERKYEGYFTGKHPKWTRQRYEIAFQLSPRDVGVLLNQASQSVDEAVDFLEDDEEGENVALCVTKLSMFQAVHRQIEHELGAALAADLEEQVGHLWAGAVDEILEERNWRHPR